MKTFGMRVLFIKKINRKLKAEELKKEKLRKGGKQKRIKKPQIANTGAHNFTMANWDFYLGCHQVKHQK